MQYPDTVQYLYELGNEIRSAKLGLDRVHAMASALGNPHRGYRVIHVAGTNGKGSTCAMIASALRRAGFRTGLYTSPHLIEPTERMKIDGVEVTHARFASLFQRVHEMAERLIEDGKLEAHPTYFETVTLMAFCWFHAQQVDWSVIEVGLGGRLDATNIVEPLCCVITPIDFDHEAWLGTSLEAIASEKAGIIKPGVPVVVARQHPEARSVIQRRADEQSAPVIDCTDWPVLDLHAGRYGSRFTAAGMPIECPLAGVHQVENARAAAVCLKAVGLTPEEIGEGIAAAAWPGRLERVSRDPDIILDGAHNPAGARALASYIAEFHGGRRIALLFGAMRDKSVEEIAGILFPLADELIVTAPRQTRALRPEALLEMAPHPHARTAPDIGQALALTHDCDAVFITGSLYLVGEARALLVQ